MKPRLQYYSFSQAAEYLSEKTKETYSEKDIRSLVSEGFFISGYLSKMGKYIYISAEDYLEFREKGFLEQVILKKSRYSVIFPFILGDIVFAEGHKNINDLTISFEELNEFANNPESFDDRRTQFNVLARYIQHIKDKDKNKNKKTFMPEVIKAILAEIKFIDDSFDKFKIPGIKRDFFNFYKSLIDVLDKKSRNEFPTTEQAFKTYTSSELCLWRKGNPSSAPEYWAEITDKLKAYKLNSLPKLYFD